MGSPDGDGARCGADVVEVWWVCLYEKNIVYIFNPSCQVPPGGCNFHLLLGYVLLAFANYKNMY